MTQHEQTVGQAIEHHRDVRLGWSVRKAAKLAGISEGWWRQIELGYQRTSGMEVPRKAGPSTLTKICRALDLDVAETRRLFDLAGLPAPEASRPVLAGDGHEPVDPPTEYAFPQAAQLHRPELIETAKAFLDGLLDAQERLDAAEEQARRAQS